MSQSKNPFGVISWTDLTVQDAPEIRNFYEKVAGWTSEPVEMDGYDDYCMVAAGGDTVAGICHAKGVNANVPPTWLVYVTVEDLQQSIANCTDLGGKVLDGPRKIGDGDCAVIQDPAGAVLALYQTTESQTSES